MQQEIRNDYHENKEKSSQNPLIEMINKRIQVTQTDGRVFQGILTGMDQTMNLILNECIEKVYSKEEGINVIQLGVLLIRGDSIILFGEIDAQIEQQLDYNNIRPTVDFPLLHN